MVSAVSQDLGQTEKVSFSRKVQKDWPQPAVQQCELSGWIDLPFVEWLQSLCLHPLLACGLNNWF